MKFNFKKVASVMASLAMVGSTMGFAVAANYPAPFTSGSVNDVAIVVGSGTGANDMAAALSIGQNLASAWGGTVGVGDESVKLERSADKFNLGDTATSVFVTAIDDRHLPSLLAKGVYRDADNDEFSFTQKIDLSAWSLSAFRDTSYSDSPAVGVQLNSGASVLNYTLDFTKNPTFTAAKMENTNLNILGKEYFVLDVDSTNDAITLLDSATTTTLSGTGSTTVNVGGKSYVIEVVTVGGTSVRLKVNDETTNSLSQGQTYKLRDGTYVGIKDLTVATRESDQHFIEVSIGSGKLLLTDGNEVEMNDESVFGLTAHVANATGKLNNIVLEWKTDDKEFITPTSAITMPGFGVISVTMTGMNYPNEETTTVENDGDSIKLSTSVKDGPVSLSLLYSSSGAIAGLGESSDRTLKTTSGNNFVFNQSGNDRYFVASWNSTTESESYLLSATITTSGDRNRTAIKNEVTGQTICSDLVDDGTCSVGNMVLKVNETYRSGSDRWVRVSSSTSGVSFNTLYTAEGMKIFLPFEINSNLTALSTGAIDLNNVAGNATVGYNATSWRLNFAEQDKNGNLAAGNISYALITANSDNRLHVSDVVGAGSGFRVGSTDKYEYHIQSDLATRIIQDRTGNEYSIKVLYSGDEAYGDIYVSSGVETTGANIVPITDTEAANLNVNMIVVGGSCINSVAASLLGVSPQTCGAAWTSATNVGAGQYLIQSFNRSGKIATLVAGYEAADTTNAANALRTQTIETTAGVKYTGSTASNPVKQ